MKNLGYKIASIALIVVGAIETSAQHQVKIAIDPRSAGETEAELLSPNFHNSCPNISIVRDESQAEYTVLANETQSWGFLHYYITTYDKQGKVVFTTNKHLTKNAIKAFCQFMNTQK
jgi:bifunctional ADP-heptose synthase (sugar kinase/adenylyltransferase)